jgi:hypothetical protein
MLFTATQAQMAPPHRHRQLYVSGSIWSSPGAYGRFVSISIRIRISAALGAEEESHHGVPCHEASKVMEVTSFHDHAKQEQAGVQVGEADGY